MSRADLTEEDYTEGARKGAVARRAVITNLETLVEIEKLVKDVMPADHDTIDRTVAVVKKAAMRGYYFGRGFAYRNHLHVLKLKRNPCYDPKRDGGIA